MLYTYTHAHERSRQMICFHSLVCAHDATMPLRRSLISSFSHWVEATNPQLPSILCHYRSQRLKGRWKCTPRLLVDVSKTFSAFLASVEYLFVKLPVIRINPFMCRCVQLSTAQAFDRITTLARKHVRIRWKASSWRVRRRDVSWVNVELRCIVYLLRITAPISWPFNSVSFIIISLYKYD